MTYTSIITVYMAMVFEDIFLEMNSGTPIELFIPEMILKVKNGGL